MLDEVHAAADVLKIHPTRLNAFASVQTGSLAVLVEDRVVPTALPVRDGVNFARTQLRSATGSSFSAGGFGTGTFGVSR